MAAKKKEEEEVKKTKAKDKKEEKAAKEEKPKKDKKEAPKGEKGEKKEEKKGEKKENISKSLVEQVKEGIIEEKPEKEEKTKVQATPKKSESIALVNVQAAKNNTIVTVTDLSGAETLVSASGGQVARTGREEKSPFAGGQLAKKVASVLKERGFRKVDVLLRGKGGHRGQKSPGRAASAVIKMLARSGIKIRKIEDVTPIPHGGCKPPGGKRGRRV
jgi:small subunit ribosomal protein S11